uniref:Uncharacterized protein n=1 Tax=Meloidogyne incognita TaxID=6306 RepID=A0A914KGF1_MELIC
MSLAILEQIIERLTETNVILALIQKLTPLNFTVIRVLLLSTILLLVIHWLLLLLSRTTSREHVANSMALQIWEN